MIPVLINDMINGKMKYGGDYGVYFAKYTDGECAVTMKHGAGAISPVRVTVTPDTPDAKIRDMLCKAEFLPKRVLSESDKEELGKFFAEGADILKICRDTLACKRDMKAMDLAEYIARNGLPEGTTQEEADEHLVRRFSYLCGMEEKEVEL